MKLNFHVVGVECHYTPVSIRSRFTFPDTKQLDFFEKLEALGCAESVILSTCNRSEVFFLAEDGIAESVHAALLVFFETPEAAEYLFMLSGDDALRHLFSVAAGLQSAIVGEDQILGQVKQALSFAKTAGAAGKVLIRAFQDAISTAKKIKTQFGISEIPLSASYIGIRKLCAMSDGLEGKTALVIGTGEMSLLAVKYLLLENVGQIFLCSRSCGTDRELPEDERITLVPFSERFDCVPAADVLISATVSPHVIFTAEQIGRREKPLHIADMAVPPDVASDVRGLENVFLLGIDELTQEAEENATRRRRLSLEAADSIDQGLREFRDWFFHIRIDSAVESLSQRCSKISADTETYLFHKLDLSPREKKLVTKMINASLHRLIREPILRLKALDDAGKQDEYIKVVKELFDVR